MRYKAILLLNLILGLVLLGCNSETKSIPSNKIDSNFKVDSETTKPVNNDIGEIQTLIIRMLKWADSKDVINVRPVLSKDSICVGFDLVKHKQNLEKLRKTGLFADEFIDNYNNIIQTLDKKIKNNEFEPWNVYELPIFSFASDANPWCSCQDYLSWDDVDIKPIKLDSNKGELKWGWGKLGSDVNSSWKEFSTPFRVVKINNKWKISYLQGFDYKESIK